MPAVMMLVRAGAREDCEAYNGNRDGREREGIAQDVAGTKLAHFGRAFVERGLCRGHELIQDTSVCGCVYKERLGLVRDEGATLRQRGKLYL